MCFCLRSRFGAKKKFYCSILPNLTYYDNNYELREVGRTLSGDGVVGSGLAKNSSGYDSNIIN